MKNRRNPETFTRFVTNNQPTPLLLSLIVGPPLSNWFLCCVLSYISNIELVTSQIFTTRVSSLKCSFQILSLLCLMPASVLKQWAIIVQLIWCDSGMLTLGRLPWWMLVYKNALVPRMLSKEAPLNRWIFLLPNQPTNQPTCLLVTFASDEEISRKSILTHSLAFFAPWSAGEWKFVVDIYNLEGSCQENLPNLIVWLLLMG